MLKEVVDGAAIHAGQDKPETTALEEAGQEGQEVGMLLRMQRVCLLHHQVLHHGHLDRLALSISTTKPCPEAIVTGSHIRKPATLWHDGAVALTVRATPHQVEAARN